MKVYVITDTDNMTYVSFDAMYKNGGTRFRNFEVNSWDELNDLFNKYSEEDIEEAYYRIINELLKSKETL